MKEIPFLTVVRTGLNATPDLLMGLAFLATWIEPTAIGPNMFTYCSTIMLLEFITIHSAGFMGLALITGTSKIGKVLRAVGLGCFYSLFIWAFTVSGGESWPMVAFWLLVLNRILSVLLEDNADGSQQMFLMMSWGWNVFCYVIGIFLTTFIALPRFGWTEEMTKQLGGKASGLWFESPQSLMAAGFLYFTAVGIFELYAPKLIQRFAASGPAGDLLKNIRTKRS